MTTDDSRRPWVQPTLRYEGNLEDIVLSGGGKISAVSGDGGDPVFKQKPTG